MTMQTVFFTIYTLLICYITYYAVAKERQELGCKRGLTSIEKQCNEDDSVYLVGTKPMSKDTPEILINKLDSVLSYHEKGAVWRRCWIIMMLILLFVILGVGFKHHYVLDMQFIVYLQLGIFFIVYFFFNYINYHHLRRLKNNGRLIIKQLNKKCKF
jgi:hypothetical protein